jgi:hypothetical protein
MYKAAGDKLRSILLQALDVLKEEPTNPENKTRLRVALELVKSFSTQIDMPLEPDTPAGVEREDLLSLCEELERDKLCYEAVTDIVLKAYFGEALFSSEDKKEPE